MTAAQPSPTPVRQPIAFIGHGAPTNALEANHWTRRWREFGESLPERPRAVLVVSAHWYIGATAVTSMPDPRTIHDFFGFPRPLEEFTYPAAGSPELAAEVAELATPTWVGADVDSWGLDHGAWSVLAHVFPEADVPVVQLSVDAGKAPEYHLDLGARLAPLRDQGVLLLASGNVVHNLRAVDWRAGDTGTDWAHRFDDAVQERLATDPASVIATLDHPDAPAAVTTPDHFLPMLYTAGAAAATGERLEAFDKGYTLGSLSMTSYSAA